MQHTGARIFVLSQILLKIQMFEIGEMEVEHPVLLTAVFLGVVYNSMKTRNHGQITFLGIQKLFACMWQKAKFLLVLQNKVRHLLVFKRNNFSESNYFYCWFKLIKNSSVQHFCGYMVEKFISAL